MKTQTEAEIAKEVSLLNERKRELDNSDQIKAIDDALATAAAKTKKADEDLRAANKVLEREKMKIMREAKELKISRDAFMKQKTILNQREKDLKALGESLEKVSVELKAKELQLSGSLRNSTANLTPYSICLFFNVIEFNFQLVIVL